MIGSSAGFEDGTLSAVAASVSMIAIALPTSIVSPSSTKISISTPASGDGTSLSTLSVAISRSVSSTSTVSPTFFDHSITVPSITDSPIWGITTSTFAIKMFVLRAYSAFFFQINRQVKFCII